MLLLPSAITAREAPDSLRLLVQALKGEPEGPVVVDAANLKQFDSSALALLLECRRASHAWGRGFVVQNAPPKLAALAKLYGIESLLMGGTAPVA